MTRLSVQYRPRTTRSLAIVTATRESSSALSLAVAIERLRMAPDRFHEPVLDDRDRRAVLQPAAGRGRRRHAWAAPATPRRSSLAAAQLRILGIDRDPAATRGRRASASTPSQLACSSSRRRSPRSSTVLAREASFVAGEPVVGSLDGPGRVVAPARRGRVEDSRFAPTRRSTCAWIPPRGRRRRDYCRTSTSTNSPGSFEATVKGDLRGPSPSRSSIVGPDHERTE